MNESATLTATNPFYTYTDDDDTGKSFRFRKPLTSELDKMGSNAKKVPVTSAIELSKILCAEQDKPAWSSFTDEFPGAAATVLSEVMAKLKFRTER